MTKEGTLILAKPRSNSMEASQPINSVSKMQDDGMSCRNEERTIFKILHSLVIIICRYVGNYDKGRYSIQKLDNARLSYRRFNDIDINEIRICADRDQPLNVGDYSGIRSKKLAYYLNVNYLCFL